MRLFKELYDPQRATRYVIDAKLLIFRVISEGVNKEVRLKPYFSSILLALFARHPQPVPYQTIIKILKSYSLACPDETRLHRKISELRAFLARFHPDLADLICNVRGIGYTVPLHFKDSGIIDFSGNKKIRNKKVQAIVFCLEEYVQNSVTLSMKCNITKFDEGFILQRKPIHAELDYLLVGYGKQKQKLYQELRLHEADFFHIRLEFILAKLKTYLGLARISEFSITKEQWVEWHEHETGELLDELIDLIRQVEQ